MTDASMPPQRPLYGLTLRLFSISCFSLMNVLLKLAYDHGIAVAELVFWRQAFSLPVVLLFLWQGAGFASVATQRIGAHAGRMILGLFSMTLVFGAITRLPLPESTTISFMTPIFATLLSILFFGHRIGVQRAMAIVVGFVGVVIVAQPSGQHLDAVGVAMGLIAAFLVAIITFQIRDLGRTEATSTTVFWFGALSTLVMLPFLPLVFEPHDGIGWLLLLGVGTLGGIAQLGMTGALRYAPVTTVVGVDYVALIWSVLFGWLIWSQLPTLTTWVGAAVIVASCLFILWREHRLQIQRAAEVAG
jgi:drug/metabolite transporter (DMT)-like permease